MQPWFWFSLAAFFIWGVWGLFAKLATNHLSPLSAVVFQLVGGLPVLLGVLAAIRFRPQTDASGITFALVAGLLGSLGIVPFLYAVSKGNLSVVVPVTALYPVLTILLGILFLGETPTIKQGAAVLFAGIAILLFSL